MRHGLGLLLLMLLTFLSGCTTKDGDIINPPDDPGTLPPLRGVRIVSPVPDATFELPFTWTRISSGDDSCRWNIFLTDTVAISATIQLDLPAPALEARLYRCAPSPYYNCSFQLFSTRRDSLHSPFKLPLVFLAPQNNPSPEFEPQSVTFYVSVTAADSSEWTSQIFRANLVTRLDPAVTIPPASPTVDTLREAHGSDTGTGYALIFEWHSCAPGTRYSRVFWQRASDGLIVSDSIATGSLRANTHNAYRHAYTPRTTYHVWVENMNAIGVSPPSDTLTVETGEADPPRYLTAHNYFPASQVSLNWSLSRQPDSILVARQEDAAAWETIRTLPPQSYWTDNTVHAGHDYTYRIGAWYTTGVWWSDSLLVRL